MRRRVLQKDTKTVLYTFIGAFAMSLLVGLIRQNPFAVVFMRAFIAALLFGALVYAVMWVLKRYIPEIAVAAEWGTSREDAAVEATTGFDSTPGDEGVILGSSGIVSDKDEGLPEIAGEKSEEAGIGAPGVEIEGDLDTEPKEEASAEKGTLPSLDGLFEDEKETVPDFETEPQPKSGVMQKGDQITLGKFQIPFEPEILAKAIKKVMSEDEGR
jgi:hypothetical protein